MRVREMANENYTKQTGVNLIVGNQVVPGKLQSTTFGLNELFIYVLLDTNEAVHVAALQGLH